VNVNEDENEDVGENDGEDVGNDEVVVVDVDGVVMAWCWRHVLGLDLRLLRMTLVCYS